MCSTTAACAVALPQRTSFSSTSDHVAPVVKRPALAPMYTAFGLTSLDQVISNRKLRWAGHVRRTDCYDRGSLASSSPVTAHVTRVDAP
jgi:hypothetical protein